MALMYWPNEKGIKLNKEVAQLFLVTKKKLALNLFNTTNAYLYTDILGQKLKKQLFNIILNQLEILILDIIELDLNVKNIKLLNYKILYDLIQKVLIDFLDINCLRNTEKIYSENTNRYYSKIIISEHKLLLENLLIYLTFGSNSIDNYLYAFNNCSTPIKHVYLILDNFIIQASNLVVNILLDDIGSISEIVHFLLRNKICNSLYISTRSIAVLFNNLLWQNLIYLYIQQPKDIYGNRYKVWLIQNNKLYIKYIYVSRLEHVKQLSTIQNLLITIIEIQDFLIPKIEIFLLILYKILVYIIINTLGNSIIFIIRALVSGFYSNDK